MQSTFYDSHPVLHDIVVCGLIFPDGGDNPRYNEVSALTAKEGTKTSWISVSGLSTARQSPP